MRSLALKLGMLWFATLLGWTCGASAAQQSLAGDRQYPNATTCTRLRAICLSSQPDCNIPSGVGLNRSGREPPNVYPGTVYGDQWCARNCNFRWEHCMQTGWWAGRLTRPAERR
jgi:hypothetical protein